MPATFFVHNLLKWHLASNIFVYNLHRVHNDRQPKNKVVLILNNLVTFNRTVALKMEFWEAFMVSRPYWPHMTTLKIDKTIPIVSLSNFGSSQKINSRVKPTAAWYLIHDSAQSRDTPFHVVTIAGPGLKLESWLRWRFDAISNWTLITNSPEIRAKTLCGSGKRIFKYHTGWSTLMWDPLSEK